MKRLVLVVFALAAAGITVLFFLKPRETPGQTRVVMPQVVSISQGRAGEAQPQAASSGDDTAALVSFIPLRENESLLQTLSADFDGDAYEDQINALTRGASGEIILLIGLYNPLRNAYERTDEIFTGIFQPRTFSYTCLDITGEHRNALLFSGYNPQGASVMRIYHGARRAGTFVLTNIADFTSDGTIFVQRLDRYDSYETLGGAGTSFPVWVYSTDAPQGDQPVQSLDQLQTMYNWDPGRGRYVQVRQNRVTGQKIAAAEIARIQDGTVGTFASFLDGIWFKSTGEAEPRYVAFDYPGREITFLYGDEQEVYSWEGSVLRRNGMNISAVNTRLTNLSRMVNVSLSGPEEIKLSIQDDVRMLITEGTYWDGSYFKMSKKNDAFLSQGEGDSFPQELMDTLTGKKTWRLETGEALVFTRNEYTLRRSGGDERGRFSLMLAGEVPVLEFRPETPSPFFEKAYRVGRDGEALTLEPVVLTASGPAGLIKPPVRLTPAEEQAPGRSP
ncbi:MAG: pallilysin-related adhesin [Spirochaetaceae bacterium]|jgi:hypothetical protein|nr:pallilysin-related adhesin [Spirochaetaceae bacterium]